MSDRWNEHGVEKPDQINTIRKGSGGLQFITGLRGMVLACSAVMLASCTGHPPLGGDASLNILPGDQLPTPGRADVQSNATVYYVGPFDRLTIDVFGIEELSEREVQVDAGGRVSFPLVGTISVSGMSPGEIEAELADKLAAQYVRSPQVTVNLKETLSRVVTVEGEVEKPGLYPVIGKMTLLRAIATAEGTTEFTQYDDIVVFRTVEGRDYAALYNLTAIRHGAYRDPDIYAGDIVMVGESRGRRLFKDILATAPALLTPIIIASDRFSR